MFISSCFSSDDLESAAVKPFALFGDRVRSALEARRQELEAMYTRVMGRPEIDPVFLTGVTILQMMERLPDRQAIMACQYDARWRLALGLSEEWAGIDPSTLVYFRRRLARNSLAKVALESGLEAMRTAGYLGRHAAVRIDSTHLLGCIADMSRLECARETLRLALEFLSAFEGAEAWEPWFTRYAERNPEDLRNASMERLASRMEQAGTDMRDVLAKTEVLGKDVAAAGPVALLRRVFGEQFETVEGAPRQRRISLAGAVCNPHEPEASWSTKKSMGTTGWKGYKAQVCETVEDSKRGKGEPTKSVITAVCVQPAVTSDHGSIPGILAAHQANVGKEAAAPEEVFVDAGYVSATALRTAEKAEYDLTGPVPAPPYSVDRFGSDRFTVDIPGRKATCPGGKICSECSRINDAHLGVRYYFAWAAADCGACPLQKRCLSPKKKTARRTLDVTEHHMTVQARRDLCKTEAYQARMRRRNALEGTHSELVRGYGLRNCRYRGLLKTELQSQFTATACNLRRWARRLCWEERING